MIMETDALLPITYRQMGTPLRWQPTVNSLDILRFICGDPDIPEPALDEEVMVFTLAAARKLLEALIRQPNGREYNTPACHRLLHWLHDYEQAQNALLS